MDRDSIYKNILDSLSDGVYFVDRRKKITYWNRGAENLTGFRAYEMIGSSCSDNLLVYVDSEGNTIFEEDCPMLETLIDGEERKMSTFIRHREGFRIPVEITATPLFSQDGSIIGAIEVFRDNSSAIQDQETIERLKKASLVDPLTGLGNRRLMEMKLEAAFEQHARHQIPFGVLMIDIDHFSDFIEKYGHEAGENILRTVANILGGNVRASDIVGCLDGEAFLGVLQHVDKKTFLKLAEKLRKLIENASIEIDSAQLGVTVTIGAAFIDSGDSVEGIVRRADRLLLKGKSEGMNKVVS